MSIDGTITICDIETSLYIKKILEAIYHEFLSKGELVSFSADMK